MADILKRQEAERKDLAAGAYTAWQAVKEKEKGFLTNYNGEAIHAPQAVQDAIKATHAEYFNEWGSDGKLTAIMTERHTKERSIFIRKQEIHQQIDNNRGNDKARGR